MTTTPLQHDRFVEDQIQSFKKEQAIFNASLKQEFSKFGKNNSAISQATTDHVDYFDKQFRQSDLLHKQKMFQQDGEHQQQVKQQSQLLDIDLKKRKEQLYLQELENSVSTNAMNDQRRNLEMSERRKQEDFDYSLKRARQTNAQDLQNDQSIFNFKLSESSKSAEHDREMEKLKMQLQIAEAKQKY